MGGEGMAKCVRGRAVGQAERAASAPSPVARCGAKRAALRADKQRAVGFQRIRAELKIILDRLATGAIIGAERVFWPLPTIVIASRFADRRVGATDRERSEMRRPAP